MFNPNRMSTPDSSRPQKDKLEGEKLLPTREDQETVNRMLEKEKIGLPSDGVLSRLGKGVKNVILTVGILASFLASKAEAGELRADQKTLDFVKKGHVTVKHVNDTDPVIVSGFYTADNDGNPKVDGNGIPKESEFTADGDVVTLTKETDGHGDYVKMVDTKIIYTNPKAKIKIGGKKHTSTAILRLMFVNGEQHLILESVKEGDTNLRG